MKRKPPLAWPEKLPAGIFRNPADWSNWIEDGLTITSVSAEVVRGDVVINQPEVTSFAGAIQQVFVSGGTPGANGAPAKQIIRCWATFDDGQVIDQDFEFAVLNP